MSERAKRVLNNDNATYGEIENMLDEISGCMTTDEGERYYSSLQA